MSFVKTVKWIFSKQRDWEAFLRFSQKLLLFFFKYPYNLKQVEPSPLVLDGSDLEGDLAEVINKLGKTQLLLISMCTYLFCST